MKKLLVLTFICSVICLNLSAYIEADVWRIFKYHKGDRENKKFPGVDLSGAVLANYNLEGIDLTGANLIGTCLEGANLTGATLKSAIMINTDLTRANCTNAKFNIYLNNAKFNYAKLDGADFSMSRLWEVKFIGAFGKGVKFFKCDMGNSDLSNCDFPEVDFSEAQANNVTFNDGYFKSGKFVKSDLSKSNLHRAKLENANLQESILKNTNFFSAKCIEADFSGATLQNTSFYNVDFTRADLYRLTMTENNNVNVDYADFTRAHFFSCNLQGFTFPQTCTLKYTKFERCNMRNVTINSKDLEGVNFSFSDLTNAKIINCSLGDTCFYITNLDNLDLTDTKGMFFRRENDFYGAEGKGVKIRKGGKEELRMIDFNPDKLRFEEL